VIAAAVTPDLPARLDPPAIVAPAPSEVSFGRVAGTVGPGASRIVVAVDGRVVAERRVRGGRFSLTLSLPPRDVAVRVTAIGPDGKRASTTIGPVFGLPSAAAPAVIRGFEDPQLTRRTRELAESFPGIAAVYVQDLRTGRGAAWNARARFPAASTLKLAIAVEVLRELDRAPAPSSRLGRLLREMLVYSDNEAANELEVWLGGSTSAGSAKVNATMRALGLADSEMFGGYEVLTAAGPRPIPLRVERAPAFGRGKYTTAYDLARLARLLHLAAGGRGALVHRVRGFTPAEARALLFLLAHSADRGKLDRFVGREPGVAVLHKSGWIATARHDAGLVYWPEGGYVAAVMTWSPGGAGPASDRLAGRVVRAALDRFRVLLAAEPYDERRGRTD